MAEACSVCKFELEDGEGWQFTHCDCHLCDECYLQEDPKCLHGPIIDNSRRGIVDRVGVALLAERKACAEAICPMCADHLPRFRDYHLGWLHPAVTTLTGEVKDLKCCAAAIWDRGDYEGKPAPPPALPLEGPG